MTNARRVVLGAAVLLGLWLLSDPTAEVPTLVGLVGLAFVVLGVIRLLDPRRSSVPPPTAAERALALGPGLVWLVVGLIGVAVPGLGLRTLAVLAGGALVIGGVVEEAGVLRRRPRRTVDALAPIFGIALGLIVLSWPTVTVLILSTVIGARLVQMGVDEFVTLWRPARAERAPGRVALVLRSCAVLVALALLAVSVVINRSDPNEPGPFYGRPRHIPGPGSLVRSEVIDGYLDGVTVHRILYATGDRSRQRTTASALVFVPNGPAPATPRPVLAWDHGTIGIARRCSPSLLPASTYAPAIPGLRRFLREGFVVVATDYAGLGSDAVNGYLIGDDEALSTLDAVRAAREVPDAHAGNEMVVFGESQGGHAALFTGEWAARYAPELRLLGVAAAAPASDLATLFEANVGTPFGDILASFALVSWSRAYRPGDLGLKRRLDLNQVVDPDARAVVDRLAELCIQNPAQIAKVFPEAAILSTRFLSSPPWTTEPWSSVIAANTPGTRRTDAPILLLQGADDPLVLPRVQARFVARLCADGDQVTYRVLPGVGHVDAGQASADQVVSWSKALVAGRTPPSTCT